MRYPSLIKLTRFFAAILLFGMFVPSLKAQTSDTQTSDAQTSEPQSWTKTGESHPTNINPTRTTESHKKTANGSVDRQTVERWGADGHYEPYYDIETETVQVNDTTVRTIERTFARDASGQRILTHTTEMEKQSLADGGEKVVRTLSNADLDGHMSVAQREVTNIKKTSPDVQEKKTTVFLSDGQGGMAPGMEIQQREKRGADHTVQAQESTLYPDGSGKWQVYQRKDRTTKEDGKERTTDERLLRQGPDGNLAPASRTLGKETVTADGEKKNTVETYSPDMAGSSVDTNLYLSQRVTVVQQRGPHGAQKTEQRFERISPTDPGAGMQLTVKTVDTVKPGVAGTQAQATHIIEGRDVGGTFTVDSFDTEKSDNVHSVDVDIAPQDKPTPDKAK